LWQNPTEVGRDVYDILRHPKANLSVLGFTLLFMLFFFFIYLAIYFIGKVMSERQKK
jgi:hypothetical protein